MCINFEGYHLHLFGKHHRKPNNWWRLLTYRITANDDGTDNGNANIASIRYSLLIFKLMHETVFGVLLLNRETDTQLPTNVTKPLNPFKFLCIFVRTCLSMCVCIFSIDTSVCVCPQLARIFRWIVRKSAMNSRVGCWPLVALCCLGAFTQTFAKLCRIEQLYLGI